MSDKESGARCGDTFGAHEHAGAPDCAYCPICSAIAVVRKTRPEVLEHLASAARELIIAGGLMLEEADKAVGRSGEEQPDAPRPAAAPGKVRRIDLG